jgi:hypothetical protein
MSTRGQVIAVHNVVVDINHMAIEAAMERNNIRDRKKCFDRVCRVFHHFLKERQEKSE